MHTGPPGCGWGSLLKFAAEKYGIEGLGITVSGEQVKLAQLSRAAEPYFVFEDVQNFGADYDRTLMAWDENFRSAWPELKEKYGERFYRMWRYYLMSCAASFRTRRIQLWQLVLARQPGPERYDAPR